MFYLHAIFILFMVTYVIMGEFRIGTSKQFLLLFLVCAFIFMAGAQDIPDEAAYMSFFANGYLYDYTDIFYPVEALSKGLSSDYGYSTLSSLFYYFGSNYFIFKCTLMLFVIIVICKYSIISGNTSIIICLYMIYPWFYDVIQIRNTLMSLCICIAFFSYVFHEENVRKYIFWVLLGTLFHKAGIVFLLFVPLSFLWKKELGKKFVLLVSMLFSLLPLYAEVIKSKWLTIAIVLSTQDGYNEFARYTDRIVNNGYLIGYIIVVIGIIFLWILEDNVDEKIRKYVENGRLMFILITFLFPLFPLFMDASLRYPRSVMLILYVILSMCCQCAVKLKFKVMTFAGGGILALLFLSMSLYSPVIMEAYTSVLENNIIYKIFVN